MSMSPQDYARSVKDNGVDQGTSLGIPLALAEAGKAWGALKPEERTLENAQNIILNAPKNSDNNFLAAAGTQEIVSNYAQSLIDRSKDLDKQQGVAEGTNLIAYMNDSANAVKDLDIGAAKMGLVPMSTLNGIKQQFSDSALKHLGITGTYIDDFKDTVTKGIDDGTNPVLKNAHPVEQKEGGLDSNPFIKMLMFFFAVLTGNGDALKSLMGADQQQAAARQDAPLPKETDQLLDKMTAAAKRLSDGTEATDKMAADLKIVADGTLTLTGKNDIPGGTITVGKARKIGDQVLDDSVKVLKHQMTPEEMGNHLFSTFTDQPAQAQSKDPAAPGGLSPDAAASVDQIKQGTYAGTGQSSYYTTPGSAAPGVQNQR